MSLTRVEQNITVIKSLLKKKKKRIDEMGLKLDLNENQKIFIGEELDLMKCVNSLIASVTQEFQKALGKLPPQDIELEQIVLGSMILENKAFKKVREAVKPDHFYIEAHKLIYKALVELWDDPTDMRMVIDKLRKNGTIEACGGAGYITELTMKVAQTVNVEMHARVLIEKALKRGMIMLAGQAMHEGYDDTCDVFMSLERIENGVKELKSWIK